MARCSLRSRDLTCRTCMRRTDCAYQMQACCGNRPGTDLGKPEVSANCTCLERKLPNGFPRMWSQGLFLVAVIRHWPPSAEARFGLIGFVQNCRQMLRTRFEILPVCEETNLRICLLRNAGKRESSRRRTQFVSRGCQQARGRREYTCMGSSIPFSVTFPRSKTGQRPSISRAVSSPMRISPLLARSESRAAILVTRPEAV